MAIDWKAIKSYENSQNTAFEEVVCQLAYNENKNNRKYTRVKAPDGGVEFYLTLENGDEIGWQAKYFFDIQDSQFKQIKKSFETAIEKHPNLIEYYVCCPIDRQDPRIPDKKYLQDRWNDFVKDCQSLALEKGITIEIKFWGAFELNNKLQKPENAGMVQFWFGGDNFPKTWFAEQTNTSIIDLGARYSAELNVGIHEITHEFNALLKNKDARTHLFEKLNSLYKALKDLSYLCNKYDLDPENQIAEISSCLDFCWKGISVGDLQTLPFKKIQELSENLINKLSESSASIDSKDNKASFRNDLYKLRDAIDEIKVEAFNLFNHPCLIVFGDAGVGKSHLLGDFANNLIKQDKPCVFILGQKLTETINPWTQILKNELRLDCNEDVFLGVLNTIGQAQQERVPFIIDALNEGKGRLFWGNTLAGFIQKFKKYPWVALLLSVRSEYKDNILANIQQDIKSKTVSEIKHYGFQYNVFEAVQSFFDYYQLALPTEPLLTDEFKNPLFLKVYCEYRRNTQTDDFEAVITDVFDNYFWSINVKVATDFGYRPNINYVPKILNRLAEAIFHQGSQSITYEEAIQIVDTHTHSVNADAFLQELLSENLLLSYQNQKGRSEILYFSYERFYDYLTAKFICEENKTKGDLKESFSCSTFEIKYKNQQLSQGLLSILSVLIPTQFNVEFFEVLDNKKIYNNYPLGYAFIDGLYWRNSTNLNLKNCTAFVNKNLFQNDDLFKRFINLNYQIAGKENHPLNANKLHDWLSKSNLADRDKFWTTVISGYLNRHSAIFTLIDWAIKQGFSESLTKNSRYLTAIAISWIFTSTNIALRDNATIALTRLLQNNIDVSAQLLSAFEKVDDPYVLERILASIYGAILSSQNFDGVNKICHLIINQIFAKDEVYPNVLVRDFSRNIVEFAHIEKITTFSESELESTRPPYNSSLPETFPSNQEIDAKYKSDYSDDTIPDYHFARNRIPSSMATEYGRGMCMYGDFGRYVFQSRLRNWGNINIDSLSNYAVEIIFEKFGYSAEKHGEFDSNLPYTGSHENRVERIGKKYQWMAMYEVVARVADNFQMIDPSTRWGEDKKYIWYNGSTEPSFRDIDPTFIPPDSTNTRLIEPPQYHGWGEDFEEWVISTENLIDSKKMILNSFQNTEWLSLHRHHDFKPEKKLGDGSFSESYQYMWYMVKAYLVKDEDFETVLSNIKNKNFIGQWMPEPKEIYNDVFNLEYYWSPLLKVYEKEFYGGYGWQNIYEERVGSTEDSLGSVYICSESHISEGVKNRDLGYNISAPTKLLFETLNLKNDKFSGSWVNEKNELVMFDASLYGNQGSNNLVIKKTALVELEKATGCRVLWTILSEKIAMYDYSKSTEKRLDISGIYYLKENQLIGEDYYFVT